MSTPELDVRESERIFDAVSRRTETEQIDGSLRFDTDDYVLEAKWIAEPVSREMADAFAAKVRRKGKNALGVFMAVNGFSSVALTTYRESTPFITMDGGDVYAVLDGRVRLDDLLRAKRRHANETGSCYLSARRCSPLADVAATPDSSPKTQVRVQLGQFAASGGAVAPGWRLAHRATRGAN